MIGVKKDFNDIPKILTNKKREEAFKENKSSYVDKKNLYKVGSIQKKLNNIYHLKCAYCEKKLLDSPKHIEHYRPKKIYYWLAYSWDNLLLSCGECNSAKGDKFPILNSRVTYENELFKDIHLLGFNYDIAEKPQIINPEKEDIQDKIIFDKKGVISTSDERVKITINICKLNREALVELRVERVNSFIEEMENHLFYYKKYKDVSRFIPTIKLFLKVCNVENNFYTFHNFVTDNIDVFFEDKKLQHIIKMVINRTK